MEEGLCVSQLGEKGYIPRMGWAQFGMDLWQCGRDGCGNSGDECKHTFINLYLSISNAGGSFSIDS